MFDVSCIGCDDVHTLTMEEYDVVMAQEEPFLCDACFTAPPSKEEPICRCKLLYGMRKSSAGTNPDGSRYFSDADPGIITDTSKCPMHHVP